MRNCLKESMVMSSEGPGPESDCSGKTRPLVREGASHQQTCNCLKIIKEKGKIWLRVPDGCLTSRQTGGLTVGRNVTSTLTQKDTDWCTGKNVVGFYISLKINASALLIS
jgi:hypothetical protein